MSKTAAEMLRERTKLARGHVFTERESLALAAVVERAVALRESLGCAIPDLDDLALAQEREAAFDAALRDLTAALQGGER